MRTKWIIAPLVIAATIAMGLLMPLHSDSVGNPPQLFQNSGSNLGAAPFFNCSTGMACSNSGGVLTATAIGSGGSVTSVATSCGLSGGTITTTGTLIRSAAVNAQTGTSYAILSTDCGKLLTLSNASAVAVTIAQAGSAGFPAGYLLDIENEGAGTVTITPTTSTIDGGASLTLATNQGIRLFSDGANYSTQRGRGPSANQNIRSMGAGFSGGGSALTTSAVTYVTVPFACTIAAYNITIDTGTISIDIWKVATGTAIPTVANTILTGGYPGVASGTAIHSTSTALFTTTTVSANDIMGFEIQAVSSATQAQIVLQCNVTS
jgi:hypothetical protein